MWVRNNSFSVSFEKTEVFFSHKTVNAPDTIKFSALKSIIVTAPLFEHFLILVQYFASLLNKGGASGYKGMNIFNRGSF